MDTFAELREEIRKVEFDKKNICFICGDTREHLEKECINFIQHTITDHNLWTYVDYIVGLKFMDPQETNAINSYVIENIANKSIAWFPANNNIEEYGQEEEAEEHH